MGAELRPDTSLWRQSIDGHLTAHNALQSIRTAAVLMVSPCRYSGHCWICRTRTRLPRTARAVACGRHRSSRDIGFRAPAASFVAYALRTRRMMLRLREVLGFVFTPCCTHAAGDLIRVLSRDDATHWHSIVRGRVAASQRATHRSVRAARYALRPP